MRYLILAAGMGKRLRDHAHRGPKCLIEIGGTTLLEKLINQIERTDNHADIVVVAGYKYQEVMEKATRCHIIVNPFFDITGINASIWFARSYFDEDILMINGDIVFSDLMMELMIKSTSPSFICYDSSIMDDKEINVRVSDNRVVKFGVNFKEYSGAYAGVIKFCKTDGQLFANLLDERIKRGFNEARTYYFAFIRRMINDYNVCFHPFDFAGYTWTEIDFAHDLSRARTLFG